MNLPEEKFTRRNLLIAIKSCQRDMNAGLHDHARRWTESLRTMADLKFFVGGSTAPEYPGLRDDEVWLSNVLDDYANLPFKTKGICRHMLLNHYRHVFLCDIDTSVYVAEFVHFYNANPDLDVAGSFQGRMVGKPAETISGRVQPALPVEVYPSGGGYFLSRKAAQIVTEFDHGKFTAEDRMVGDAVRAYNGELIIVPFRQPIWYAYGGSGTPHSPVPWPLPPADHVERQSQGMPPRLFEPSRRPTRGEK